jgi:hypothetical protein
LLAFSAPAFTVEGGALVEAALDGEPAVLDPPLEFTSLPEALPLRCRPTDVLRICEDHRSQRDRPRTLSLFLLRSARRSTRFVCGRHEVRSSETVDS